MVASADKEADGKRREKRDAEDRASYGKRLRDALALPHDQAPTVAELALYLDMSYQGVKKYVIGAAMPSAKYNAMLAKRLKVSADWLATGEGEARVAKGHIAKLFRDLDAIESQVMMFFRKLSPHNQDRVVLALNNMVNDGSSNIGDPFAGALPDRRGQARGVSQFGDLEEESSPKGKRSK